MGRRPGPARRRRVPDNITFATKPALARQMIAHALDAGTPASWVAGDEVYGNDPGLRAELVTRRIGYVLAVAKDHRIGTGIGVRRAIDLAVRLPPRAWQRHSAGRGAKGNRWYDWALVDTTDPAAAGNGCHWLLIRRNARTGEMAFYRAYSPARRAGPGRRNPLEDRRIVPIRQGTRRTRRTPTPPLDLLAPLDHPGHARPRLPVHHDRHPAPARPRHRADSLDPQRDPPSRHRSAHPHSPHRRPNTALVTMAAPTPSPSPHQPLPPTSNIDMITIYGWSIRQDPWRMRPAGGVSDQWCNWP
jgi:hypothetical protein